MEERPTERTIQVTDIYQDERDTIRSAVVVVVLEYCENCRDYHKEHQFVIFTN